MEASDDFCVAIAIGHSAIAIGHSALAVATTGVGNMAIGHMAPSADYDKYAIRDALDMRASQVSKDYKGWPVHSDDSATMSYAEFVTQRGDNPDLYLFVAARWLGLSFPVIDADCLDKAMIANEALVVRGRPHVLWESSPGKFWLIMDPDGTDNALTTMAAWPGQDVKYAECCARQREVTLRAFPRNGLVPRILAVSGDITPELEAFCGALRDHFDYVESYVAPIVADRSVDSTIEAMRSLSLGIIAIDGLAY